jgi:hypothetical protein
MTFAVLCTGPSLSPAVAESVRHLQTVAVNTVGLDVINSVTGEVVPAIAPWATALAANDVAFWAAFPQAREFAGRRFSANRIKGVERIEGVSSGHCSGVLALEVAKHLGATRILLLGCDMHGTHYFGPYAHQKLKNTTDPRRKIHIQQFAQWGKRNPGIEVINCTPGSALQCFPHSTLEAALC